MDRERWKRIERVLDRVLETPPEEREGVLAELCGSDDELAREVRTMLESMEAAEGLFENAPPLMDGAGVESPEDEWERMAPGTVIGRWRIVREIGRGGMGAVFQAERADGQFEQTAALKIVKRGMDSDEILQRFRHERQILAHLEHPNIAGLMDGGRTDDGLPYFVMELAQGRPLDEYCDRLGLSVRERVEMFLPVCDAVHYAHRNLVVHRDLKPDNIVVVDGLVKLLDFGIAKLLGADDAGPGITQVYTQRLTPRYAAPEQVVGGTTTTAADVYSLGVVLYELLSGVAPYEIRSGGRAELERVIGETIPSPPSQRAARVEGDHARRRSTDPAGLSAALRGDLDAICLKALRKEPTDRYESAAALADDLRRHLRGTTVRARPQTRRYRLARFVKRNRVAVGLASAAGLSLLLGTAVSLWQAAEARRQSELRLEEAERAIVARDYLTSWLTTVDPNRLGGQREFTVEELVEVGFDNLGSLDAQPPVRAAVLNTLGGILFNFGRWSRADSVYRTAYAALAPRGSHPDLAVSMMGIGEVWRTRNRFDSARAWFEEALRVRRETLPAGDPRIADAEEALAFVLYNLGTVGERDPHKDSLLARASDLRRDIADNEALPDSLRASALEGLGDIAAELASHGAAVDWYREAYALRVEALGAANPENGRLLWGLAEALWQEGDTEGAEDAFREAVAILRQVYREPNPAVATAHYNLGRFLSQVGRPAESSRHFRRSAEEWAATGEDDHVWAGWSWVGLGMALLDADSAAAAEGALRRGLSIYQSVAQAGPADIARARADLGASLAAQGRAAEALAELRRALPVLRETADEGDRVAEVERLIEELEADLRDRG